MKDKKNLVLELNDIINRDQATKVDLNKVFDNSNSLSIYPFEKGDVSSEGYFIYQDTNTNEIFILLSLTKMSRSLYMPSWAGFKECLSFAHEENMRKLGMNFSITQLSSAIKEIWREYIIENKGKVSSFKNITSEELIARLTKKGVDFPKNKDISELANMFREALEELNLELIKLLKNPANKFTILNVDNVIAKAHGFNTRRVDNTIHPGVFFTKDKSVLEQIKVGDDCLNAVLVPLIDINLDLSDNKANLLKLNKDNLVFDMINGNCLNDVNKTFKLNITEFDIKKVEFINDHIISNLGAALQHCLKWVIKDKSQDLCSSVKNLTKNLERYLFKDKTYHNINQAYACLKSYKTELLPNLFGKKGQDFFNLVTDIATYIVKLNEIDKSLNYNSFEQEHPFKESIHQKKEVLKELENKLSKYFDKEVVIS